MKKLLLFCCLLAGTGSALAGEIDSLKRELSAFRIKPEGPARDSLRCQILMGLMRAYMDVDVDSAEYYNQLLRTFCQMAKRPNELIYAYQYKGYLYQVRGDYHQSVWHYFKALTLADSLDRYARMAGSHRGLAHAYASLKQFDKAKHHILEGLRMLRKESDANVELGILNVQGAMYREQGKLAEALAVNQRMYSLARREGETWYESHGLHAIGWVYMEMGDLTTALRCYEQALSLCRQIGSIDLEGSILLHIVDVYVRRQKWKVALRYCYRARQTARQVKNSSLVAEAEEKLYRIFRQTNQPAPALEAYENFVNLKDSLSREKNQHRIETLQAQYDNEQKTNALQAERMSRLAERNRSLQLAKTRDGLFLGIVVVVLIVALLFWNNRRLQAKNRQINRQRVLLEMARKELADVNKNLENRVEERTRELVKANQELIRKNEEIKQAHYRGQTVERKRVALELHDNLSSLLSAVSMSMQSINPKNLTEPEQSVYQTVRQLIQNAYAEVRNISHNILPAELEREGLTRTLSTLVDKLNQSSPLQISLTITGLQERLPIEIEFNLYSITLELLNNVIKHAQATTVGISLFRTDAGVDLTVTDDGIGLQPSQAKRGIGLQNIQTRLDALGGTFNTVLPSEKGTWILIKIPIETVRINGNLP
ncbi:tetratricopeptide repeat-containing sensor histidine kinase [Larkinella sp. VNQ87]|uniref:tetratricopeptide repeat-containing sensor histidine kinase n=1 Tax=Larkinella sp. VNQ87 TaxID=3400921 RepID=UPI003C011AEB